MRRTVLLTAGVVAMFAAALAVALSASAAKPIDYTIALDQAAPAYLDEVTFTVTPDPAPLWIELQCFQDGTLVYSEIHSAYDDGTAYGYHLPFLLGPTYLWVGGAADCTASLVAAKKGSISGVHPADTVEFSVSG